MTRYVTEDDLISAIPRLTRQRLLGFVEAEIVLPVHSEQGLVYRQIDHARAELACDLTEDFDLHDDAICMVLSLVDQLHGVRAELKVVLDALEDETPQTRTRIGEILFLARSRR